MSLFLNSGARLFFFHFKAGGVMDDSSRRELHETNLRLRQRLDQLAGRQEVLTDFLGEQVDAVVSLGATFHDAQGPVTLEPSQQRFIGQCLITLASVLTEKEVDQLITRNAKLRG